MFNDGQPWNGLPVSNTDVIVSDFDLIYTAQNFQDSHKIFYITLCHDLEADAYNVASIQFTYARFDSNN